MITIKDDYGNDYEILDIDAFKNHIKKYHSFNGKGDGSIHEENGYWFKVSDEFYKKVKSLQYKFLEFYISIFLNNIFLIPSKK